MHPSPSPTRSSLVDSYSTDRTLDIARSFNARIFTEDFKGHGGQKNSAIDKCTGDWILLLDADEVLSPDLQTSIRTLLAGTPDSTAYWINRSNQIFGRFIRHGGYLPRPQAAPLPAQRSARMVDEASPHSTPGHTGPKGRLQGDLLHYAYPTLATYLEHMQRYSSEMARLAVARGKTSRNPVALRLEHPPQPHRHLPLQLHLPPWLPRRPRRSPPAHLPLSLRKLEIRQSLGAFKAQTLAPLHHPPHHRRKPLRIAHRHLPLLHIPPHNNVHRLPLAQQHLVHRPHHRIPKPHNRPPAPPASDVRTISSSSYRAGGLVPRRRLHHRDQRILPPAPCSCNPSPAAV